MQEALALMNLHFTEPLERESQSAQPVEELHVPAHPGEPEATRNKAASETTRRAVFHHMLFPPLDFNLT